jgi:outer membrane beta-barrel protein
MKRPAVYLFVLAAIVGWAATGHAKKASKPAAAPAAAEEGGEGGEKAAAPAAAGEKEGATPAESLDTTTDETTPGKVEDEISGPKKDAARPTTTLSWQDILVVPRKPFLKGGRLELAPFAGTTINDNLIRHYVFGVDLNYFLTDAFWVGVQGQYFVKQLSTQAELVGLQFNRTSTLNRYLYGGSLNFGYVPAYGKFALVNRTIVHWEIYASAGFGATFTEVIARDPAEQFKGFKTTALTPNVGIGTRFFVLDWLTLNVAVRDYIIPDKFEPVAQPGMPECATSADCKTAASSQLVNNLMVYAGVGLYVPTKFTYKTPR